MPVVADGAYVGIMHGAVEEGTGPRDLATTVKALCNARLPTWGKTHTHTHTLPTRIWVLNSLAYKKNEGRDDYFHTYKYK